MKKFLMLFCMSSSFPSIAMHKIFNDTDKNFFLKTLIYQVDYLGKEYSQDVVIHKQKGGFAVKVFEWRLLRPNDEVIMTREGLAQCYLVVDRVAEFDQYDPFIKMGWHQEPLASKKGPIIKISFDDNYMLAMGAFSEGMLYSIVKIKEKEAAS